MVHDFIAFLGLFPGSKNPHFQSVTGERAMKNRIIAPAVVAVLVAIFAGPAPAHDTQTETVTAKFDQAIANIPGKSLRVVEVEYAPGAASLSHTHAKSAFIYAYVRG
jgi:hypothetical protein